MAWRSEKSSLRFMFHASRRGMDFALSRFRSSVLARSRWIRSLDVRLLMICSMDAVEKFFFSMSGLFLNVMRQILPRVWSLRLSLKSTSPCWMMGLYQSAM